MTSRGCTWLWAFFYFATVPIYKTPPPPLPTTHSILKRGGGVGLQGFIVQRGSTIHRKLGIITHFRDNCATTILKTVKTPNNLIFLSQIES